MNPKEAVIRPKGVSSLMLFLIGLSGGFISAVFPRLITFLTVSTEETEIFSKDFLIVAVIFGIIIGVSMYWLYLDTKEKESTKNLFMASLALPSILSGGMNMANTTHAGQNQINELSSKNKVLEKRLDEALNLPSLPSIAFDEFENLSFKGTDGPKFFGISSAYAAGEFSQDQVEQQFNPGVKFNTPESKVDHVIVLELLSDKEEATNIFNAYKSRFNLPDLAMKKSKDKYYIMLETLVTKSDALIKSDRIRKEYALSPKLLRVK